eukprot:SAG11_NODE_1398_length_5024_cov_5.738680_2_plen_54_part_00
MGARRPWVHTRYLVKIKNRPVIVTNLMMIPEVPEMSARTAYISANWASLVPTL